MNKPSFFTSRCTVVLAAVNVCAFVITELFPVLKTVLALNTVLIVRGRMYWQFLTYMFVHGSFLHLAGNMLGLVFFGAAVERAVGTKNFAVLYVAAGIVSGAASFLVYTAAGMSRVLLLGASGAVYAVLLVFSVLFPRALVYLWGILPVPAPILVTGFALLEIFNQVFGAGSGVAHMTHLFGFAAAWVYVIIRMGKSPWTIWKNAYRN